MFKWDWLEQLTYFPWWGVPLWVIPVATLLTWHAHSLGVPPQDLYGLFVAGKLRIAS